jgi:hypothetical protein
MTIAADAGCHRPDRLQHPCGDQHRPGGREAAPQAREREDGDADHERPILPDQIADPTAEGDQRREGEQIRVHHPGESGLVEAQIPPDLREGDADHGGVHHDHGQRPGHRDQDQGTPAWRQRGDFVELGG